MPHDLKCSVLVGGCLVWGDPSCYLSELTKPDQKKKRKKQKQTEEKSQLEAADHYHKQILITYLILLLNKKTGNRR